MKNARTRFVVIVAAVFGAFYSVIVSVLNLVPLTVRLPAWLNALTQVFFAATVALLVYLSTIAIDRLQSRMARGAGFKLIEPHWFPGNTEQRVGTARKYMTQLLERRAWPIQVYSITGEWDICKPYTEKQLRALLTSVDADLQVILAHPLSPGLRRRCEKEGLNLRTMQRRILHSTHFLDSAGGDSVHIGWHMEPPYWHLISDSSEVHFSPFVDGVPGHDTPRYIVDSTSPFFATFRTWFADQMTNALDARRELPWVERSLERRAAVFLDRDNTLIADVAYFTNPGQVEISILPGVVEGLKLLQKAGLRLIVISNQHPVGLGIVDPEDLALLTKRIKQRFAQDDIHFDAFYYCTHRETEGCHCRKPGTQLFEQAAKKFDLALPTCHFIGDSEADAMVKHFVPELNVMTTKKSGDFLRFARNIVRLHGLH